MIDSISVKFCIVFILILNNTVIILIHFNMIRVQTITLIDIHIISKKVQAEAKLVILTNFILLI